LIIKESTAGSRAIPYKILPYIRESERSLGVLWLVLIRYFLFCDTVTSNNSLGLGNEMLFSGCPAYHIFARDLRRGEASSGHQLARCLWWKKRRSHTFGTFSGFSIDDDLHARVGLTLNL
jgi:hypothetical protein